MTKARLTSSMLFVAAHAVAFAAQAEPSHDPVETILRAVPDEGSLAFVTYSTITSLASAPVHSLAMIADEGAAQSFDGPLDITSRQSDDMDDLLDHLRSLSAGVPLTGRIHVGFTTTPTAMCRLMCSLSVKTGGSTNFTRWLLVDHAFYLTIKSDSARTRAYLAHEIGHHINYDHHSTTPPPDQRLGLELAADRFAGFLAYDNNVTLDQVATAFQDTRLGDAATRGKRAEAARSGWRIAADREIKNVMLQCWPSSVPRLYLQLRKGATSEVISFQGVRRLGRFGRWTRADDGWTVIVEPEVSKKYGLPSALVVSAAPETSLQKYDSEGALVTIGDCAVP